MTQHREFPGLGRVVIQEIFDFYDEPVLFTCITEANQTFLVVLSEAEQTHQTWLAAPVSDRRLQSLLKQKLDIHSAFKLAEGGSLYRITTVLTPGEAVPSCSLVQAGAVDDSLLPTEGEFLQSELSREDSLGSVSTSSIPDVFGTDHRSITCVAK